MASRSFGHRKTRQRDLILRLIRETRGPLTVEEVLDRGRGDLPSLGIATVYRTVKLLTDAGLVRAVHLPDGQPRYEATEREHHYHFQCRRCVQVFCIDRCPLDEAGARILPRGFQASDHELTVYGLCPECR